MPVLSVPRGKIYYEVTGSGNPLILLAGWASDHLFWFPLIKLLADKYQVITLDNRGIGQSNNEIHDLTIDHMAEDIAHLIRKLQLKETSLAGHSMGGMIAQTLAVKYPELIQKMVLLNTTSQCREASLLLIKALMDARLKSTPLDLIIELALPLFYGDEFLKKTAAVNKIKKLLLTNQPPIEGQMQQYHALLHFKNTALDQIKTPTLIGAGAFDIISLVSEAEYLQKNIPHSLLVTYPSGHAAILEIPTRIASIIKNFV